MGIFISHDKNTFLSLRTKLLFAAILLASIIGAVLHAPTTFAADAEFTTGAKTAILYQGKTYNGPNVNEEKSGTPTGWRPSGKDGDTYGTRYYVQDGNGDVVIWFEKDSNNAHWSEIDKPNGQPRQYWTLKNTRNITVSINRDIAQRDAMKSVFKNSVMGYANNVCSKAPFAGNTSAQRECRDTVSSKFDSCWSKWTNPDDFTIANPDKPAEDIKLKDMAGCIAETDIGKSGGYFNALQAARDKANSQGADAYNNAIADDAPEGGETGSSCRIDGVGWLICPMATLTAGIIDGAYEVVANLLTVQPITTTVSGNESPIYEAWTIMRNFANIAFVIAFLIIVFSQVTGIGISNYGIKKLIPRLIMAAIFVNISFWICAIAVDASNIAGTSLKGIFDSLGGTLAAPNASNIDNGQGWLGITGFVLGSAALVGIALYTTLAALLPALVAALAAIVTVFLVLTLRQALIILLIVISPLAFVAFLLPNTQNWFTKWRQLFQTLLLMFPIIAVIFGASAFASEIVMESAEEGDYAVQIMGALISIIPLAITPVVMKTAGGLLNRFGGIVNNPNKGPFDKLRKGAEGVKEGRQARARALRMNGQGANKFSRGVRKTFAVPSRIKSNLGARRDRNIALNEAADAGYALQNKSANEAAQIRMATAAANSAKSAGALQGITTEAQEAYLGVAAGSNRSLDAAIRGQISQGERQAIGEIEAQIAPQSANQLGTILENAIKSGDTLTAQAAQNRLSDMGNKGADVIAQTINSREKAGDNANWDTMRTELARNMKGGVMEKNEALKNWAVRTEVDENGKLVKEVPVKDDQGNIMKDDDGATITKRVPLEDGDFTLKGFTDQLLAGGKGNELSADKFKKQTPSVQKELLNSPNNPISENTLRTALNPNNIASFDPEIIKIMEGKLNAASTPAAPAAGQQEASPNTNELKIDHSETPTVVNNTTNTTNVHTNTTNSTTNNSSSTVNQSASPKDFADIVKEGGWKPATPTTPAPAPTVDQTVYQTNNNTLNETNNIAGGPRHRADGPSPQADSSYLPPQTPGTGPSDIPDWFNK